MTRRGPSLPRGAELALAAALAIAFTVLASHFPLSGDDWAWGSQLGLDRLAKRFGDYNGRYAGNLAVLGLTRAGPLLPVVMALTVVAIVYLVLDLSDHRTLAGYLTTFALVLGTPIDVWRQGIVWTSGFSNYALGTLFMLLFLRSVMRDARDPAARRRWPGLLLIGATGFVGQLFIEHVTSYLLAAGAAYVGFTWWRRGRPSPVSLAWFTGLVAGAALMFSNGAYRLALSGGTTYQSVGGASGSRLETMHAVFASIISKYLASDNSKLNIVLFALVSLLALDRARRSTGTGRVLGLGAALVLALVAGGLVASAVVDETLPSPGWQVVALVAVLATLVLSAFLVGGVDRTTILGVTVSILVVALPLLVVTPLGPRCFVPTYVLLLVAVNVLLRRAVDAWGVRWGRLWSGAMVVALAVMLVRLVAVYTAIDDVSEARLASIRHQVADGATSVVIPRLPHHRWVHVPDPNRPPWDARYKRFHGLPPQLKIRVQ